MLRPERRVAVTGVGMVTPIGTGLTANWQRLLPGCSGIGRITRFDASALPVRIAGEVRDFEPAALSNSFGFGGANTCLAFREYRES